MFCATARSAGSSDARGSGAAAGSMRARRIAGGAVGTACVSLEGVAVAAAVSGTVRSGGAATGTGTAAI